MTVDEKILIERCIILPLALKVFIIDQKQFENFYSANAYLDILESVTEQIRKDIMATKECLYNQYNIIVQKQSKTQYKWMRNNQSGILVFSSEDLKEMTSKLMKEYLFNLNVKSITKKPRIWKQIGMDPPDNIYLD